MKICFIVSGNNIFFDKVAGYFESKKHEIHAIVITPPINKLKGVTYYYIGDQSKNAKRPFKQFCYYKKIKKLVNTEIKPDIVSAFYIAQCGWLGAFVGFHPFILHVMGSDFFLSAKDNKIKIPFNKYALRKADIIISEADILKKGTSKVRKTDKNNYVIQYGVKLELFKPSLNVDSLRKELNIGNGDVIISPRNNSPIYNHDIVIEAFSYVLKSKSNSYLLIKAQNSDKKEELEKIAQQFGVLDRVRFFGFIPFEELPLYYNLADIFVSVPSSDSVPVTLQEAMACGVPPIVSDLPAVKEWVQDGVNGYVIPIRDADALVKAIIETLESKKMSKKFINHNLELVKGKSNFYKNMEEMLTVYQNTCLKN